MTAPPSDGAAGLFARLLAEPGVAEHVVLRRRIGIAAFHGGSLERGTDTIARRVAARAGASLYTVALPDGLAWHVPSHHVDPAASDRLRAFLDHVQEAISLHGFGRPGLWGSILLGGRNRELARQLGATLRPALPGYTVIDDLEAIPRELRGLDRRNPVNRVARGGVHLELPPAVRGLGPRRTDAGRSASACASDQLVDALVAAVASHPTG